MKTPLVGNPYQGRSPIASAQTAINLYAESNAESPLSPFPFTEYPTPGTLLFTTAVVAPGANGICRCLYRTSIDTAYVVIGPTVYFMATNGALVFVGSIADQPNQVYMADNGLAVLLVDGTTTGYAIDINANTFGTIIDPSFYGADFVLFLDTFFVFNRSKTNQFYISLSNVTYAQLTAGTSFDPLDIAAKSGSADPIIAILATHQNLWLIGALTTEIWIGTGAADFFFQQVQGAYIDHGCAAPYSASNQDVLTFWLMQDRQGKGIIVKGVGYDIEEISTPYIVAQINKYQTITDAIGFCFQVADHAFYALVFPTANHAWLYDLKIKQWCEWLYIDNNGAFNRPLANCSMFWQERNIVGDFSNGNIYILDFDTYTDNGQPITHIRTFPHMLEDGDRVIYKQFIASMQVGTADPPDPNIDFPIFLSFSDDGGITYGQPLEQSLGQGGQFLTQPSWNRLGMARDRVFKLQWSAPFKTALNGAFVDAVKLRS
jgi:hypothetical protein